MRRIEKWLLCVLLALSAAAYAETSSGATKDKFTCSEQQGFGDVRDFSCPVNVSGKPMHFRFKANFSGSHDDTMVGMTASLNGAALTCAPGSKTELMGEDGDVSLECKFSIDAAAGSGHLFKVLLKWSHAQYTDFEFDSE